MTRAQGNERFLHLYVQHHWIASKGGLDLFRRGSTSHSDPHVRSELAHLANEVEQDREALRRIVTAVGAPESRLLQGAAAVGERLGRLKLNGTLVRRSPVSDLFELEMMSSAVAGKRAGWLTLRQWADGDPRFNARELDELIARAERQLDQLAQLHIRTASRTVLPSRGA